MAPYVPGLKEGLALVNGAPLAPALAAHLTARARALLEHATLAGALAAVLSGASARPYSPRIGTLKGDPAQQRIHARLSTLVGPDAEWADRPQAPVSFRVLPQVHGAVLEQLEAAEAQVARELRAVTDSPLFLEADGAEPAGFYPSGNFHSQALCLALDALAIGVTQVANLSEKRLHRLLDSRFSHLPDQLAAEPGRQTGLVFLHKAVIGFAAENRMLAAPAAVHTVDTSTGQEDFQAFTFLAAEQLGRILDNLELILASELVAARQAHHLRGVAAAARAGDRARAPDHRHRPGDRRSPAQRGRGTGARPPGGSVQRVAAVDDEHRPGREARRVAGQVEQRGAELLGRRIAAHRRVLDPVALELRLVDG